MCKCHKPPTAAQERMVERLQNAANDLYERAEPLTLDPDHRHRWHLQSLDRLDPLKVRALVTAMREVTRILEPTA